MDERVIDREAHEPLALAALVGLAGGQRDVRGGHGDPQRPLRERSGGCESPGECGGNCD